jgi:acetyl esterase
MFKEMDIQTYREKERDLIKQGPNPVVGITVGTFRDKVIKTSVGDTRLLIYYPANKIKDKLPVFINLHGGGFVGGVPEVDDIYCRKISDIVNCLVVNVDYALAPEHKFPAAIEECYDIAKWLHENPEQLSIDPQRIAIGGHSAGGNLAAAVCLLAKERKEFSIKYQIIDYAPLDLVTEPGKKKDTDEDESKANFIELGEKYNEWYLKTKEDAKSPLASPVLATNLENMPPALVITAEYDLLCNEAEIYARNLEKAGVEVIYKMYQGCTHGFTHIGPKEAADDAWMLMCTQLKRAFDK